MSGVIVIDNLTKIFPGSPSGETVAFRDLSLTVEAGEFICLLGPSGCGKTTLLMSVAGFELPTSGTITVDGSLVTGPGRERGIVFQEYALFPWRTVRKNVTYGLELRAETRACRDEIANRFLRMVDLEAFADHYPYQLSGGMRQRVAIARSLAVDPNFLLMDEPFGALDAFTRNALQRDLEQIWQMTNKTILFVTHAVQEACVLADRIIVFTARPAGIKGEIVNNVPRPRSPLAPEFNALERQVVAMLGEEATVYVDERKP